MLAIPNYARMNRGTQNRPEVAGDSSVNYAPGATTNKKNKPAVDPRLLWRRVCRYLAELLLTSIQPRASFAPRECSLTLFICLPSRRRLEDVAFHCRSIIR